MDLLLNAGVFLIPLGLCSVLAVFIAIERIFALRRGRIVPRDLLDSLLNDSPTPPGIDLPASTLGRIVRFFENHSDRRESLIAYARLEVSRMERGLFLLEVVVGAAPLIGLLGTVTGLTQVFGNFSVETGMPSPGAFIQGIALALTTTIIGLAIAIPALIAHAWLLRRVEAYAARLHVAVECLLGEDTSTEPPSIDKELGA